MRYRLLGNSGLRVSELALGTMTFGDDWGWGANEADSHAVFEAFVEAGGNFIDTANKYTNGTSEQFVGRFIASERERFVVATKYMLSMREGDPNASGSHRKNLVQSVEASLRRLNVDYIDLLWVHAWDEFTPVEETMRALDDLVRSGKVLYVGVSDAPAWEVARANTVAQLRGWTPFVGLQIEYSLLERTPERDLLPMAAALDLGVTAWGPLAAGLLTGKYSRATDAAEAHDAQSRRLVVVNSTRLTEHNLAVARAVDEVADDLGVSSAQVALAWVRAQGAIPIVGARTREQMVTNLGFLDVQFEQSHLLKLNAPSAITLGFPHQFLLDQRMPVHGTTYTSTFNHRARVQPGDAALASGVHAIVNARPPVTAG